MKYLLKYFSNNGHLRGLLYFLLASLPIIVASLESWSKTPPPNWYAVAAVIMGSFVAGLVSLRAYLDQHLSHNGSDPVTPAAPVATIQH